MPAINILTIRSRVKARLRRRLLAGVALLAPLVPVTLLPECFVSGMLLDWIASISLEQISAIAALTNALTLMP